MQTKITPSKIQTSYLSRRQFVRRTSLAAGAAAFTFPYIGRVLGANDRINIACIGVGGKGDSDSNAAAECGGNIVAICDVDDVLVDAQLKRITDDAAGAPAAAPPLQVMSKAQAAANARRPPVDNQAALRRFTSEQLPRLKRYRDYRDLLAQSVRTFDDWTAAAAK